MKKIFEYCLEISSSLTEFETEIKYAFGYVNRYYGLKFNNKAARIFKYGGHDADMPATFFEEFVRQSDDGINLRPEKIERLENLWPKLPPKKLKSRYQTDSIGLIFFMLSRIEEKNSQFLDKHDRFLSSAAFAVKKNWSNIPIVDEFAYYTAGLITGAFRVETSSYSVKLTHDVDRLKMYHRPLEPIRYAIGDFVKRDAGFAALKRLKAYGSSEPWSSVLAIIGLSKNIGFRSNFFFMGPSNLQMDSPYCVSMKRLLKRVSDTILDSGHDIGFHPGYASYDDVIEFNAQKKGLEEALGVSVRQGRQHVIRYNCAKTPLVWEKNNMTHDYSLFFPDIIGFRNGACHSYQTYDLVGRRILQLQQTSTAIAEFSLLDDRYNNYGVEKALEMCLPVIQQVKKFNGELVILFHTHQMDRPQWTFYKRLLTHVT